MCATIKCSKCDKSFVYDYDRCYSDIKNGTHYCEKCTTEELSKGYLKICTNCSTPYSIDDIDADINGSVCGPCTISLNFLRLQQNLQ